MSTKHWLDSEGAVACTATANEYGSNVTSALHWVTCPDCIDVLVPNAVHLANHVVEEKVTGTACGRSGAGVTVAGLADRNIYDGALTCPACKEKFCYPCVLTPGLYQGGTCPYCFGDGVDKTPHGAWGDHCPWCAQDWKVKCFCFQNALARAATVQLAEMNTHRLFQHNSASSRRI